MSADELFMQIGFGHANALRVPDSNRAFRALVSEANTHGDCIINVGNGYYRPNELDPQDKAEFEHYFNAELHRAEAIRQKAYAMKRGMQNNLAQISFF